ncbi:MAG TPA: hypothetical protein VD968_06210, partial [Pyrinomonadaceae bacterium]|nr:hypothetical protein [Pyrinomonadaceae bacterium]
MRFKAFTSLLAGLLFLLLAWLPGGDAHAQRRRPARPAQQQTGDGSGAQAPDRTKRVFVGRGADGAQGSRVTIKSDDTLNDYSAYRSGDRFYVVLPKADASAVARGGSGRGYSDMQVQQRGDNVVLSYRVQPGAKPRVEQKFNRLDVIFDVQDGGAQQPAQGGQQAAESRPAQQQQAPASSAPSNTSTPQTAAQPQQQAPAGRTPAEAAAAQQQQQQQADAAQAQQPGAEQPLTADAAAQQAQSPAASPESAAPAPQEVAQAEPPKSAAPITV